jgi:hypothetical protein
MTAPKKLIGLVAAVAMLMPSFLTSAAEAPVTVTISNSSGFVIPQDFSGLSFGAVSELTGHGGVPGLMFNGTNTQLITLFKNSGLHHLRLGGTTVEGTNAAVPDRTAIDDVFAFAKAADVKVIYSLPLLNGDSESNATTAKYIWNRYRPNLEYFAIGNEPDVKRYLYPPFGGGTDPAITNYESFLGVWRDFARAVVNAAPGAKIAGFDAAGRSWTARFAAEEKGSGSLAMITQHFYVGGKPFIGDGPDKIPAPTAIEHILSTNWVALRYPPLYESTLLPARTNGLLFRLTESDDYLKGIDNASDSFASALWALEYLHWWAAHDCAGVNFHNTEWLKTDTVYWDDGLQSYQIHPKAYGVKAFELGSQGSVKPVVIFDTNGLNLSAYAVGDAKSLCVTILNKEHGPAARTATATVVPTGFSSGPAKAMFLLAPNNNPGATNGMTLGGGTITNNAPWRGEWASLSPAINGRYTLTVPPASAAVVKISTP